MSSTLSLLPPDLLKLFFNNCEHSNLLLRLWKCGNALLNSKLATAITRVDLVQHGLIPLPYPRMLSNFSKLRDLSIKAPSGDLPSPGYEDLVKLPLCLESLLIHTVPFLGDSSPKSTVPRFFSHIKNYTNLVSLIVRQHSEFEVKIAASNAVLSSLPPSLTHLAWPVILNNPKEPLFMSLLPRSLTSLDTGVILNVGGHPSMPEAMRVDWAQAPPSLLVITRMRVSSVGDDFSWLPRTLTSCDLGTVRIAALPTLPPLLLKVAVYCPNDSSRRSSWASMLPKGVTSFALVTEYQTGIELLARDILDLPPGLKSIECDFRDGYKEALMSALPPGTDIRSIWPHKLETLRSKSFRFTVDSLAPLPRTLTELNLDGTHDGESNFEDASLFPPLLTSMTLRLDCYDQDDRYTEFDVSSLTNLTNLDASVFSSVWKCPPGLTRLRLAEYLFESVEDLPQSLTELDLSNVSLEFMRGISALPPRLKTLKLQNCLEVGYTSLQPSNIFSTLKELETIDIPPQNLQFRSNVLRELYEHNKCLKRLRLNLQDLKSEDIPFIPPQLSQFEPNCRIDWLSPVLSQHWPMACLTASTNLNLNSMPEAFLRRIKQRIRDY